jgi:hypothetical protein
MANPVVFFDLSLGGMSQQFFVSRFVRIVFHFIGSASLVHSDVLFGDVTVRAELYGGTQSCSNYIAVQKHNMMTEIENIWYSLSLHVFSIRYS